jgi:SAM-dependent methyltransferase
VPNGVRQKGTGARGPAAGLRRRCQRAAFGALYGRLAFAYDRFTDRLFLGEWERWQDLVLPLLPAGGTVVELGSGTGSLAARGAASGRRWCCLEPSRAMVAVARGRCRRSGAWLVRADARLVPLADGAAAAVVATFPTSYILDAKTQAELARILPADGRLVIVLSGALRPDGFARRVRCVLLRQFYGRSHDDDVEALPPFEFACFAGELRRVPTEHGEALVYVGRRE